VAAENNGIIDAQDIMLGIWPHIAVVTMSKVGKKYNKHSQNVPCCQQDSLNLQFPQIGMSIIPARRVCLNGRLVSHLTLDLGRLWPHNHPIFRTTNDRYSCRHAFIVNMNHCRRSHCGCNAPVCLVAQHPLGGKSSMSLGLEPGKLLRCKNTLRTTSAVFRIDVMVTHRYIGGAGAEA
jgi:hypothetical protein